MELNKDALQELVYYMFYDEQKDFLLHCEPDLSYNEFMEKIDSTHIFMAHWKIHSFLEGWNEEQSNQELYKLYQEF